MRRYLPVLALLLLAGNAGATIHVVQQGTSIDTIKKGMDACDADSTTEDIILVYPGTYTDNWGGSIPWKPGVIMRSTAGAASTIIVEGAMGTRRFAVLSDSCASPNYPVTIGGVGQGFTFRNYSATTTATGQGNYGGGLLVLSTRAGRRATVSVIDCVFDNCDAGNANYSGRGGGVYAKNSSGGRLTLNLTSDTFRDCTVTYGATDTSGAYGGAICAEGALSTVTVDHCTIGVQGHGNSVSGTGGTGGWNSFGGGIMGHDGALTVTNSTIQYNTAQHGAGCIYWYQSGGTGMSFSDNLVQFNKATRNGGGLWYEHGSASVAMYRCTFKGNRAALGGGVTGHATMITLNDCFFYADTAGTGGAIYAAGGFINPSGFSYTLNRCVLQGNVAIGLGNGSAIDLPEASASQSITLDDCTVAGNINANNTGTISIAPPASGTATLNISNSILAYNDGYAVQSSDADSSGFAHAFSCVDWYNNAAGNSSPAMGAGTNGSTADPKFCTWTSDDVLNDDLRLDCSSEALSGTCGRKGVYGQGCGSCSNDSYHYIPIVPLNFFPELRGIVRHEVTRTKEQSPLPLTGPCCAEDGTCTITTQADCAGAWDLDGKCTPNNCPLPIGSCCDAEGACVFTSEGDCTGTWTSGQDCDPNPCEGGE